MASKTSEARARVALDPAPFEKGSKAIMAAANRMSSTLTNTFKAAGVVMLAAFGARTVSGLANTVKEVLEFGEQMANAGKRAGIAAGQFYLFNSAVQKGIGLKTAAGLLGKNAEVLTRSANVFRDVSIKLWAIGEQVRGFWLGLMERVAPVLSTILDGALGDRLLEAGNTFGEAIAHGVGVIYQLAKDGKLWATIKEGFAIAFDYAIERLLWFDKVAGEVLSVFSEKFAEAIVSGLADAWQSFQSFVARFAESVGDALYDVITNALEKVFSWVEKIDGWLNRDGGDKSKGFVESRKKERDEYIQKRRDSSATVTEGTSTTNGKSLADRIKDIFAKDGSFSGSSDLNSRIEKFGEGLEATFTKFQREQATTNAPKTFENNTRRVASGADSLAAIGAGGGVYMGLSLLDVSKSQLKELQRINERLGALGGRLFLDGKQHSHQPIGDFPRANFFPRWVKLIYERFWNGWTYQRSGSGFQGGSSRICHL